MKALVLFTRRTPVPIIHVKLLFRHQQQWKVTMRIMLPNDVLMSVRHLDHVLIVYSSMKEFWNLTASPQLTVLTGTLRNFVVHPKVKIDWDKAKVVDREAQWQTRWIKEALWIRKTPTCMNRDAGSYQLSHTWDQVISRSRAPSSCKQARRDQDVQRTSKRCY